MGLTLTKKIPEGKVAVQEPGKEVKEKVVELAPVISDKPMANVGLKVGWTKNLGDYNSMRVDVSLYLPCDTEQDEIDKTFEKVSVWCDLRMGEVMAEYEQLLQK